MGKTAFVFPGQGAQTVGMGRSLCETSDAARAVYELCGTEVQKMSFEGPRALLNKTVNAQSCLFASGLAVATALEERGVRADGAAGFSLGEIPAAAFAGLFTHKEAYDFVLARADAMDRCLNRNPGAMLAVVGLDADTVDGFKETVNYIYPANYNAPGQTVVATREGFQLPLTEAVKAAGGKAIPLKVEGAFHSPLMDNAAMEIADYLRKRTFGTPRFPLYANLTARPYDTDERQVRRLLADQINHPVRWHAAVDRMIADGFDTFVECGPGKVLAGLIKKINPNVRVFSVFDAESLAEFLKAVCI